MVEVVKPLHVEPPTTCLIPLVWDDDADPATNGQLWASWSDRAAALELATGQIECLRRWAADVQAALRAGRSPEPD